MANDEISDDLLERYRNVGAATVFGGARRWGFEPCLMGGVSTFRPDTRLAARARTLRFVPYRTDILEETRRGEDSPEYQAAGSCGPGDVLVCDALGMPYAGIGGDVKLLQLKMVGAEGVVTDGAVRDMDTVLSYGYAIFAGGRTPGTGQPYIEPYQANVTIQCGGVLVRPGDLVVGDNDGVVVVPKRAAAEIIEWVEEHEEAEEEIKSMIQADNVAPGRYYNEATFEKLIQRRRGSSKPCYAGCSVKVFLASW